MAAGRAPGATGPRDATRFDEGCAPGRSSPCADAAELVARWGQARLPRGRGWWPMEGGSLGPPRAPVVVAGV